jgi:hypothetical protein
MPKRKREEMSKECDNEDEEKEDIPMPPQDDEDEVSKGLTRDNAKAEIDRILNENTTSAERFFTDLRPIKRYKRTKRGRRPGICVTTANMADALGGDIFRALDVSSTAAPEPPPTNTTTETAEGDSGNTQEEEKEEEDPSPPQDSPLLPPAL